MLRKFELEIYIDDIIGYGQYKNEKPDAESLNISIQNSGISRENTVYIGDSYNDVLAANNAGIDYKWLKRDSSNVNHETEISSLTELVFLQSAIFFSVMSADVVFLEIILRIILRDIVLKMGSASSL